MKKWIALLATLICVACAPAAKRNEVNVARGRPFGHLPMMVMQYYKLYEKHAAALGISGLKVNWQVHPTVTVGSDALLSGNTDILSTGTISAIVLWSKTKDTPLEVRNIAAEASLPTVLVTRDPAIKSIRDITPKDRIALVGAKVSNNAILLQMAAAKEFGQDNFGKLDPMTVTRSGPDAVAALLSPNSEINIDFNIPPYVQLELENPITHEILSSADILGDRTFSLPVTTKKFYDANPVLMRAFYDALAEAEEIIAKDKKAAVMVYRALGDKVPQTVLIKALDDPATKFTMTPTGMGDVANWMEKTGLIAKAPADWKQLFFPIAHDLKGS